MKKQGELTHKEAVKKALEELGGRARLKDIYPRVIPLVKYKPGSDIKATLRRLLQTTPEFFRPVEGMKGWWELVSYQKELADKDKKIAELTNSNITKDGIIDDLNLWYIQPNLNIDKEMGIKWGTSDNIDSAEPLSEYGTKKKYKDITGFDPYNIQLQNVNDSRFVTSHQTSTNLHDGILIGDYTGSGGTTNMSLEAEHNYAGWDPAVATGSEGYDHTNLTISNQTFMAVSDANGNMQLMPRFDHTKRVNLVNNSDKSYTTLQAPENHAVASADKNSSMGTQTIFFVRAQRLEYHIINNKGQEALRYKRTGDYYPAITDHFKSPIATDFTYYTGLAEGTSDNSDASAWEGATGDFKRTLTSASLLTDAIKLLPRAGTYYYRIGTRGSFTYKVVTVTTGLLDKQITGSLAAAGLNTDYDCEIQVRYKYDEC